MTCTTDYIATARAAIQRSSEYDEMVTVRCSPEEMEHLRRAVTVAASAMGYDTYDQVETRDQDDQTIIEMWDASDASGSGEMDWRVHLVQR